MKANTLYGRRARSWLAAALTIWVLAARATIAHAEPAGSNEADLKIQADTLMGDSKWAEAGPFYSKLYAMTHKSGYLWNAAVCKYRLAMAGSGSVDEAEALFNQYLGAPDLSSDDIKEAKRCVADLEAYKAARAKEAADKAAAAAPPAAPTPAPEPQPATSANQTSAIAPVPAAVATSGQGGGGPPRTAAYVVGGIAAASIVAGAVFSGIASSKESSVTGAKEFNPSDDSLGETAHTMQYVMYAVGAAGLATAGILYALSPGPSNPSGSVALHPAIGPGFAGAGLSGHF